MLALWVRGLLLEFMIPRATRPDRLTPWLFVLGLGAAVVFVQSYVWRILPDRHLTLSPAAIQPLAGHAYAFAFTRSEGDERDNPRSGTTLWEDGHKLREKVRLPDSISATGAGRWMHQPGRILFSTTDNSDPRTNGRTYTLSYPVLQLRTTGLLSAVVCLFCLLILRRLHPAAAAGPSPDPRPVAHERGWLLGAVGVFSLGLYFSTGTLSPYANTGIAQASLSTGYLSNLDHAEFTKLFAFVDGQDRSTWADAQFLRRILFPVLAWPLMKLAGFTVGGFLTSLVLNLVGFVFAVGFIRREVGPAGGVLAAWLLALYPGAAYWAGLPCPYALIFPCSLLLMIALHLLPGSGLPRLVLCSLGMGVIYLGYDLYLFFLPASILLLLWRRRWCGAVASGGLQLVPLALWTAWLTYGVKLPLQNANTAAYRAILMSYFQAPDPAGWPASLAAAIHIGLDVSFGANFIFLPLLFLTALVMNPYTARIRLSRAEIALLVAALAFFFFNNLAPGYTNAWSLRGTWIARLYQPVFPVFVFYLARWWQHFPATARPAARRLSGALLAAGLLGNALIIFGPVLHNPLGVSGISFYRFYDHTDLHWIYEQNLDEFGRRPLGFPRPLAPPS